MANGHSYGHETTPAATITQPLRPGIRVGGLEAGVAPGIEPLAVIDGTRGSVRLQNPTEVADGWAIGWDSQQWMLMRARKRHAEITWQPVAYIASGKDILRRCMSENSVQPHAAGDTFIVQLPPTFREFKDRQEINHA